MDRRWAQSVSGQPRRATEIEAVHRNGERRRCEYVGRTFGRILLRFPYNAYRLFDPRTGLGVRPRMELWSIHAGDLARLLRPGELDESHEAIRTVESLAVVAA